LPATTDHTASARSSVDPAEIARFSAIAAEWWNPHGKFAPLHRLNPARIRYIRDQICAAYGRDPEQEKPLAGLRLLDVGCGGGLVAEPLSRLGAQVTAIDADPQTVGVASTHGNEMGLDIEYLATSAEALAEEISSGARPAFDVVLALEIVEHVSDVDFFTATLAKLLGSGALLVMSTLNRTAKSWLFAIIGAEWVMRWLPRGTHDWKKFLKPSELARSLERANLTPTETVGLVIELSGTFRIAPRDLDVNYMMLARSA
jgi:2-polyprenyl-6-hydroxyphenyl methylase / 3-demethylubiquinone-9 3-methyltransferase